MKKIEFVRQKSLSKKLDKVWRKPKGRHSKLRQHKKGKGRLVSIGYKTGHNKRIKNVYSTDELKNIKDDEIIRIGKMGMKKRLDILKKLKGEKIRLDNIKDCEKAIKNIEDAVKKRKEESKTKKDKKTKKKKEAENQIKKKEEAVDKEEKEKEEKRKILEKK